MLFRRSTRLSPACALVLAFGLGFGSLPLPMADYHNVRHQHGSGEVCRLHDHLLRWHSEAGATEDVATLHWHWLPPVGVDAPPAPSDGPGLHAHTPDFLGSAWDDGPRLASDGQERLEKCLDSASAPMPLFPPDAWVTDATSARAAPSPVHAFTATFAPRARLSLLLQRWTC